MLISHLLIAVGWIIYVCLHSLLAHQRVKDRAAIFMGIYFRYYRLLYNLFAFVFLFLLTWQAVDTVSIFLFKPGSLIQVLGGLVGFTGLVIMAICIKKYFREFLGLDAMKNSGAPSQLMISGIHAWVRHPLYTGTFLFVWGGWLMVPTLSFLIINTIITVYTLFGIQLEEKKLVAEFGDDYKSYRNNVPMLFPQPASIARIFNGRRRNSRVRR